MNEYKLECKDEAKTITITGGGTHISSLYALCYSLAQAAGFGPKTINEWFPRYEEAIDNIYGKEIEKQI